MESHVPNGKASMPQQEIKVLDAMGGFLLFFGLLLLIPAATAKEVSERVTDLASAIVLLAIGGGMFWRGVAGRGKAWVRTVVMFAVLMAISVLIALCVSFFTPKAPVKAPPRKTPQEAAASEKAPESGESAIGEKSPKKEQDYPVLITALRQAGFAMRRVVEGIPLRGVKIFAAVGFSLIALVVWLVRRETVFEGTTERGWWRDVRVWTAVAMAALIIIYLVLGT
jgi:hypothetical protein